MPAPEVLAALYRATPSIAVIAEEFGVTSWTVTDWLKKAGIERRGRGSLPVSPEAYFAARVPDQPPNRCWLWQGVLTPAGYGQARVKDGDAWQSMGAHKLSYTLHKGPVDDGLVVRHICHNRQCCNPQHLDLGTHQDNADDKVKAGRATAYNKPAARRDQHRANLPRLYSRREVCRETDCWNWTGGLSSTGYGRMVWNPTEDSGPRAMTVHRASWLLHRGPVADGLLIRHLCHNKLCFNPDHLELGTARDNAEDERKAGKLRTGEAHHMADRPDSEIVEMRELYAQGQTQRAIARRFGVSKGMVASVVKGRMRAEAGGPIAVPPEDQAGANNPSARLTEDDVRSIRTRYEAGTTQAALAAEFGVTAGAIAHIVRGNTWKHVD